MHSQLPASAAASLGAQFDQTFGVATSSSPPSNRQRAGHAAPVYLRDVALGEHFILDSAPQALYVRAFFADVDLKEFDAVPVVVIAAVVESTAADNTALRQVGGVFNLSPLCTVRLVDVLRPIQARAR